MDSTLHIIQIVKILTNNINQQYWKHQKKGHCGQEYDPEMCIECRHEAHCSCIFQVLTKLQFIEDRS